MHIETIRFDDVFDAAAHGGHFSFRSSGKTHYGVKLQNNLIPRAGATYTIAFAQPGHWDTVLGWRDLASSEVELAQPTWALWLRVVGDFYLVGLALMALGLVPGGGALALAIAAVLLYPACYQMRRNRAVRRALQAGPVDGDLQMAR